ncbi:cytochrome C [Shewanella submarina]|uniref:Cytochrome C n=1 Tax=Shewanella submarina TaxID=2016376 RepID=A0ABV7GBX9_9GAMM|nr:cytochrome C [Shewanella submarina]MCL1037080.1 cytochrome C [Shewanella submarina]
MKMNRRDALHRIVGISSVAAGATLMGGTAMAAGMDTGYKLQPKEKLKYVPLDPMATAKLAYESGNGCMFQVFHSVVTMLARSESVDAEKFASIPTALAAYGFAGVVGQGTICGNLNAIGMLVNILDDINGQNSAVVDATFRYYEHENLPWSNKEFVDGIGSTEEKTALVGSSSVANSILCHSSISNWSRESGLPFVKKGERCYRLSATMAYVLVELLNKAYEGQKITELDGTTVSELTKQCQMCHNASEPMTPAASVKTNMECKTCHTGHFF